MKTIIVIGLLTLAGFVIHQFDLQTDPSGQNYTQQYALRDTSIPTGLIADPSGTAYLKVARVEP